MCTFIITYIFLSMSSVKIRKLLHCGSLLEPYAIILPTKTSQLPFKALNALDKHLL